MSDGHLFDSWTRGSPGLGCDIAQKGAVPRGHLGRVTKSRTPLSDFTFTFHFHALEKEMATYSSIPAWKIPWTEEPGGLQSLGLQRVGHD